MTESNPLIAEMAVEFWKALRAHERTLQYVSPEQIPKLAAQIRYSISRLESLLEKAKLSLILSSGLYSPNLPFTVVNADEVAGSGEPLIIERTVEPAVVHQADMCVIRMGKLLVQKGVNDASRH